MVSYERLTSEALKEVLEEKYHMIDNIRDNLSDVIADISDDDLFMLHNEWCDANHYFDNKLYVMSDLDDVVHGTASEILNELDSCFDINDDYFYFNDYNGCLCSTCDVTDVACIEDIISWLVDEEEDYGIEALADFWEMMENNQNQIDCIEELLDNRQH